MKLRRATLVAMSLAIVAVAGPLAGPSAAQPKPVSPTRPAEKKTPPAKQKPSDNAKSIVLQGKVVPYRAAFERLFGLPLQENWAGDLLALETSDGRLIPVLPTESARFFYQDETMRNRLMQLTARVREKTPGLEIIDLKSVKDGKLHDIYYWCEICSIRLMQLKACECCQGPLEVREVLLDAPKPK